MKKVHLLYTMALLSLSATGRLYCAEERNSNWMTQLIEYSSETGLPMVSSDVYDALTPEKKAEIDAEIERLKNAAKIGAVLGGVALAGAAYNQYAPTLDQMHQAASSWVPGWLSSRVPDRLKNAFKPSAAPIVDRLITDVLYRTNFIKEAQWSKSFRWMLKQIAEQNAKVQLGFIELIRTLKLVSSEGPNMAPDEGEEMLKQVFISMGAKSSWIPSYFSTETDYNTVDLYRKESLDVPGKLTGQQIVDRLIRELETINSNLFNFLY